MLFSDAVQLLNTSTILSFPFFRCTGLQFALKRFCQRGGQVNPSVFCLLYEHWLKGDTDGFFWRAAVACMCPPIKKARVDYTCFKYAPILSHQQICLPPRESTASVQQVRWPRPQRLRFSNHDKQHTPVWQVGCNFSCFINALCCIHYPSFFQVLRVLTQRFL